MLVSLKLDADFSAGCAGRRIGHLLFAIHPHLAILRPEPRYQDSGPKRVKLRAAVDGALDVCCVD
jgi:hypothetical protein